MTNKNTIIKTICHYGECEFCPSCDTCGGTGKGVNSELLNYGGE